jgi:hypothetical protein
MASLAFKASKQGVEDIDCRLRALRADTRSAIEGSVHYRGDGGYLLDKAISQGESRDQSRLWVPRVLAVIATSLVGGVVWGSVSDGS